MGDWAEELWAWAKGERFRLDDKLHRDYIIVLESFGLYDRVDALLTKPTRADYVFLSGLMNIAAEHYDWQRADALWDRIVKQFGVKPNDIANSSWSKVHLLCGRPMIATQILDDFGLEGITDHSAEEYVQALLVVCHSSPTSANVDRLQHAMKMGSLVIQRDGTILKKRNWTRLTNVARLFISNPKSFMLHDVLIEWKAKTQSVMKSWPNYSAGSKYLDDYQTSSEPPAHASRA